MYSEILKSKLSRANKIYKALATAFEGMEAYECDILRIFNGNGVIRLHKHTAGENTRTTILTGGSDEVLMDLSDFPDEGVLDVLSHICSAALAATGSEPIIKYIGED